MAYEFIQTMTNGSDLPEYKQKKLGKSEHNPMPDNHNDFIQHILKLIETGTIDPFRPTTLLNPSFYPSLPDDVRAKADLSIVNMASLIQRITEFYESEHTPNESIELQAMIDHLWETCERFGEYRNTFVF